MRRVTYIQQEQCPSVFQTYDGRWKHRRLISFGLSEVDMVLHKLLAHLPTVCTKPIVGFSDATALLAHGWRSRPDKPRWTELYHGPVLNPLQSV